jgi:hypothetical protein
VLLLQGVFLRRHQVTKEEDGSPMTPADLAVGQTVSVYGRTFFVVDADSFTRNWYSQQLGLELAAPGTYPADPVEAYRAHFGLNTVPGGLTAAAGHIQPWHGTCRISLHAAK